MQWVLDEVCFGALVKVEQKITKIPSVHHMNRTELHSLRERLFKRPVKYWGPEHRNLWREVKRRLAELNGAAKPCGIGRHVGRAK